MNAKTKRYIFAGGAALILLLAVVLCLSLTSCGSGKYDKLFSQAESAFLKKDYDGAVASLEKAVAAQPTEEAYLLMAEAYSEMGDIDMAIQVLYIGYSKTGSEAVAQLLEDYKTVKNGGGDVSVSAGSGTADIGDKSFELDAGSLVLMQMELKNSDIEVLSSFTKLESLSLSDNELTDISPLAGLRSLSFLQLSDNSITSLAPLRGLTKLKTLYIDGNPITDFSPLYSLSALKTLSMKRIDISESQLEELQKALPNCSIYSDTAIKEAVEIELGDSRFMSDAEELELNNEGLTDVTVLGACTALETLSLRGNQISDISSVIDMQGLVSLDISSNSISDLRPLMTLEKLQLLAAADNEIRDIAVVNYLPELRQLDLSGNSIESFAPLANLKALESLKLSNCGLGDADLKILASMSSLRSLDITDNEGLTANGVDELKKALPGCEVTASDLRYVIELGGKTFQSDADSIMLLSSGVSDLSGLENFSALKTLVLTNNSVSDISPLRDLNGLEELDLYANNISDLSPLAGHSSLKVLDVEKNSISDLSPLSSCTGLRELYLSGNNILGISALSNCKSLEVLELDGNGISDISALSGMSSLRRLDLDNNDIGDLSPLASLSSLEIVYVRGNPIDQDSLDELQRLLPDCRIVSDLEHEAAVRSLSSQG